MMTCRFLPVCVALMLFFRSSRGTFPEEVIAFELRSTDIIEPLNTGNQKPIFEPSFLKFGAPIPEWTITTAFGFERQYCTQHTFSSSGSFGDLQYDQTDSSDAFGDFLQVVWLPNEDQLYEDIFHETTTLRIGVGITERELPVTTTTVPGICTIQTAGTEVSDPGEASTVIHLQFIIYKDNFSGASTPSQSSVIDGSLHTGKFDVFSSPKRVAVGYLLLARADGTADITDTNIQGIMGVVSPYFCTELGNAAHHCCDQGTPTVGGETCANCNTDYFGECCDKMCVNGIVTLMGAFNRQVCQCNMNWGGEQCDREGASEHFISMKRYTAKQCQDEVTNHFPYRYDNIFDNKLKNIIDETGNTNEVSFGIDGSLSNAIYGQSYTSLPLIAASDMRNDFLFAASIDKPMTHTGNFSIKVLSELRANPALDDTSNSSGMLTVGSCMYMYDIIQRYDATSTAAIAEIFFVIGRNAFSTFPSDTMLATEDIPPIDQLPVVADTWTVTGTGMTGLIMGYNYVAKTGAGAIPYPELLALLDCYATKACSSLPDIPCRFGTIVITSNVPQCVCDPGWIGPSCNLPLC